MVAGLLAALLGVLTLGTSVSTLFGLHANAKAVEADAQATSSQREARLAREAESLARRREYGANMLLTQNAWEQHQVDRFLLLLGEQQPRAGEVDLRGFEWHYWLTQFRDSHATLKGHTREVYCVAFSPDGKRLASASDDCTVKVWDATTLKEQLTFKGHNGPVTGVAFSPDGKRLASASADSGFSAEGTVKVWDPQTGQERLTLRIRRGRGRLYSGGLRSRNSVSFSPDGKRLVSANGDDTVQVWDAETGREILILKGSSAAFSPDSKYIASTIFGAVKVWDTETGKETPTLKGFSGGAISVAFSPDGQRLASVYGDWTVIVWDAATGKELLTLKGHTGAVNSVAFSPDGRRLASAGEDQTVRVWDAATAKELLTLKGHTGVVTSVTFSPDGKRLASGSCQQVRFGPESGLQHLPSSNWDQTLNIWDAETGPEALTLKAHARAVCSVAFSPDGRRLASASGVWDEKQREFTAGEVKVWTAETGKEQLTITGHTTVVCGVSFSPDGKQLASASADGTVKVWEAQTGKEVLTLKGHSGVVYSLAFSRDGRRLASVGGDQTVRVWDSATGEELLTLKGHTSVVTSVAFSPDGKQLASASTDGTVKVWEAQTGKEQFSLQHQPGVFFIPVPGGDFQRMTKNNRVAFSPDGKRLAVNDYMAVKVWDATTGQEQLNLKGHTKSVWGVCFSPDGERLASASEDKTVKVWDAQTGQEQLTLKGHTQCVTSVVFSPDGARLVSSSDDGTVKVWDAARGREPSP
jgi:WD40 repeat protein